MSCRSCSRRSRKRRSCLPSAGRGPPARRRSRKLLELARSVAEAEGAAPCRGVNWPSWNAVLDVARRPPARRLRAAAARARPVSLRSSALRELRELDALLRRGASRAPRAAAGTPPGRAPAPAAARLVAALMSLADAREEEVEELVEGRHVDGALHQRRAQRRPCTAARLAEARRGRAREGVHASRRPRRARRSARSSAANSMILSSIGGAPHPLSAGRPCRSRCRGRRGFACCWAAKSFSSSCALRMSPSYLRIDRERVVDERVVERRRRSAA